MITVESTESISRPPGEVFAFVSDVRNDPRWHTDILEARLTRGESVSKGSAFAVRIKPFMGQSRGTITVSEHEPPRRVVFQAHMGKLEPTIILTVQAEGEGSRVTRRVELEPEGIMRLVAPVMGGMMRKRNAGFLANLKRVLGSDG